MSRSAGIGSVWHLLTAMCGVWHDHLEICSLSGELLSEDPYGSVKGASPFDNLVYIDFDGELYRQTNVTFAGRPLHVRSFTGQLRDGILHFDTLGPNDPGHIGVAAGPNTLIFTPARIDDSLKRYNEPDTIYLPAPSQRIRTTVLYRDGIAVRTLHVRGYKIAPIADRRVQWDPRGVDGPVHELRSTTDVFAEKAT